MGIRQRLKKSKPTQMDHTKHITKLAARDGLGRFFKNSGLSSLVALILANSVPIMGVLFFDWDYRLVIALFWIENLVIGAFNLVKMFTSMVVNKDFFVITPLFFIVHYGIFCSVHGVFLWGALELGDVPKPEMFFGVETNGIMSLFAEGLAVFNGFIELYSPLILLGILSLVLSQSVSFIENFILNGDVFTVKAKDLMAKPYTKIIAMHAGIIIGMFLIAEFGSSIWLLLTIILFKTMVDVWTHVKQHNKKRLDSI